MKRKTKYFTKQLSVGLLDVVTTQSSIKKKSVALSLPRHLEKLVSFQNPIY